MYKEKSGSQVLSSYHVPGGARGTFLGRLSLAPPRRSAQLVSSSSSDEGNGGSEVGTYPSSRSQPAPMAALNPCLLAPKLRPLPDGSHTRQSSSEETGF